MAHYAFLDENNKVIEVITGKDENDTNTLPEGFDDWEAYYLTKRDNASDCKRTSYNTQNNAHLLDGTAYRGNFAGMGYTYDTENDVFIPPKPYQEGKDFVLDTSTWNWVEIEE